MGYGEYLRELLRPLGVYDLAAHTINGSELDSAGLALDAAAAQLDYCLREGVLATAEERGLTLREALFARHPAAVTAAQRRSAIAALGQIDGDGFTPEAISRAISGCGIRALAQETERQGVIRVTFPETAGKPPEFERIAAIILDILPCHLAVEFYLRYLTWAECEVHGWTWAALESVGHTWESFELAVEK